MRVVIGSYPQQNLLRDAAEGCPRARGPVDDVGPREPRRWRERDLCLVGETGTGPTRHTAGGGRGAGRHGTTTSRNRMIMDICWYRLPCACHPIRRFWLYVAASTASKHGRRLQYALVTHGDACSSRTVLRKVLRRIVRPFAVRRAPSSVHHGHAAAAARRARGRPRRVAVGPRPSRPELSVRTPPGAPAHRARSAPGPRPDGGIRCRACARPTSAMSTRDTFLLKISEERYPHSGGHPDTANGSRRPPRKYMS